MEGQLVPNRMKDISSTDKKWGGGRKTFSLQAKDIQLREFSLHGFIFWKKVLLFAKNEKGTQGEGLKRKRSKILSMESWLNKRNRCVSQQNGTSVFLVTSVFVILQKRSIGKSGEEKETMELIKGWFGLEYTPGNWGTRAMARKKLKGKQGSRLPKERN